MITTDGPKFVRRDVWTDEGGSTIAALEGRMSIALDMPYAIEELLMVRSVEQLRHLCFGRRLQPLEPSTN